jgi:guanosine-3',5'-bis(diphosphate) 3'-pyrophosphohydrolase
MARLMRLAAVWAAEIHRSEDRDGESPLPYIHHLLETAHLLRWIGGVRDEEVLAAAILHDAIESGGAGEGEIARRISPRAASLAAELTRAEPAAEEIDGLSPDEVWRLRSDILLSEIGRMSREAQSIKLADRLSNFREAKRTRNGRRWERYQLQTDEILQAIPREANAPLWDELQLELAASSGIFGP